jgi:major membrane immunogen (membrane-anchored lipoprotein)
MKNKIIKRLLISIMTISILTGCGSQDAVSETVEMESQTETSTETETDETETSTETETFEEETSTVEETQTSSIVEVTVDGDFTFAADVSEEDKAQILKARDAISIEPSDCDENGDGIIDKDEAVNAAFLYDDELIEDVSSLGENIKKAMLEDFAKELEERSASYSTTVDGNGKVESWADETANTPQIDYDNVDTSDLEKNIIFY